jgi:hypothetical protein
VTEERRRHPRASLMLEIRWEDLSGRYNARITDISIDGCYIESIGQVTVGQQIRFEIQLPTGSWVPFRGEVVNHQPNLGFGVRFVDLTEPQKKVLAQML